MDLWRQTVHPRSMGVKMFFCRNLAGDFHQLPRTDSMRLEFKSRLVGLPPTCVPIPHWTVIRRCSCSLVAALAYQSYNSLMLINFVGTCSGTRTLTREQSKNLLQFCRAIGATLFTVNFVFAKHDASEKLMQEFYARLSQFSGGEKELENACGDGFGRQPCWVLDERSMDTILNETDGDLFANDVSLVCPEF